MQKPLITPVLCKCSHCTDCMSYISQLANRFPFGAVPQPGLRTEEGCHHCLHGTESQYCSHPAAVVSLGHLCNLERIYT